MSNLMLLEAAAQTDLTRAINTALSNIYTDIGGIVTALCAVGIAITLVLMMVSKNQRAVDGAREWRNRIIGTWLVFNALGTIVKYGSDLISGAGFKKWNGQV